MPVVSVVLVFPGYSPHLESTVASVLAQTWRDFEFVMVDNGAGLNPERLGHSGRDPRLVWVRLPRDEGIGVAINAGVAEARGEFIALHDWDDHSYPTRLERQVAELRRDPTLGIVSALADRMDSLGRPLPNRVFTLRESADFLRYSQYAAPFINPVAMGRRDIFLKTPWRREFRYAGDLDFQARVCERWRAAVLPEPLLRYRWHACQATQRHSTLIAQSRHVIALLTARRRAGRGEQGPVPALGEAVSPGEHARAVAEQALAERFAAPAAYLARRSIALDRRPQAVGGAMHLAYRAWRRASAAERRLVAALFLKGAVRALQVRPA